MEQHDRHRRQHVDTIRARKHKPGRDIVQYGFGPVTHTLVEHGLLDELRLWVHPFFVGRGGPQDLLFREGPATELEFVEATPLASGIVILTYSL
jgi:dihydrofolate reductase